MSRSVGSRRSGRWGNGRVREGEDGAVSAEYTTVQVKSSARS